MNAVTKALAAGAVGAGATTLLHQLTRLLTPDAPRVDLLGMQALAHVLRAAGARVPAHDALYNLTLAGDLVSNSGYFSLVGVGLRDRAVAIGGALGVIAGVGAIYLPPYMGLSALPTERTGATKAITVALYTAGGLAAGVVYGVLPD